MKHPWWAAAILLLAFPLSAPAYERGFADASQRYRFHAAVDMVSLSITVTDPSDHVARDLTVDDFTVYEDGTMQEIEFFSHEDLPLRMVIVLDTSASMLPRMSVAQEAAIGFVGSLKPEHRVKVVVFNDRVLNLVDFTSDFDGVADAIRRTVPRGNTSLYDSLYLSLRDFSVRRHDLVRQVVVVLTDGADTDSMVSFGDVRELAREVDAAIYSVCLFGTREDQKRDQLLEVKFELLKLAEETGGSAFTVEKADDLASTYGRIATELKTQYHLGYRSTNDSSNGAWRRIQVRCERTGVQMRTRAGYYARGAGQSPAAGSQ